MQAEESQDTSTTGKIQEFSASYCCRRYVLTWGTLLRYPRRGACKERPFGGVSGLRALYQKWWKGGLSFGLSGVEKFQLLSTRNSATKILHQSSNELPMVEIRGNPTIGSKLPYALNQLSQSLYFTRKNLVPSVLKVSFALILQVRTVTYVCQNPNLPKKIIGNFKDLLKTRMNRPREFAKILYKESIVNHPSRPPQGQWDSGLWGAKGPLGASLVGFLLLTGSSSLMLQGQSARLGDSDQLGAPKASHRAFRASL